MTVNLNITDDLRNRLSQRAEESGYDDIQTYAEALLKADVEQDLVPPEIEKLLLGRIDNTEGSIELAPTSRDQFRADVTAHRRLSR